MATPEGYYPDPSTPGQLRYWDGENWSTTTQPAASAPPLVKIRIKKSVVITILVIWVALAVTSVTGTVITDVTRSTAQTCLRIQNGWTFDGRTPGQTIYSGSVTNTCAYDLTHVSITFTGYASGTKTGICKASVAAITTQQTVTASCTFTGNVDRANVENLSAWKK